MLHLPPDVEPAQASAPSHPSQVGLYTAIVALSLAALWCIAYGLNGVYRDCRQPLFQSSDVATIGARP